MIGIYGASGFIGQHLYNHLQTHDNVIGTYYSHKQSDLMAFNITKDNPAIFNECKIVIVAGAITDMAVCADNPKYSYAVNVVGVEKLVRYLLKNNIRVIFLSSNQVFNGEKGDYSEIDTPDPKTIYGKQKHQIEKLLQDLGGDYLILRLSKIYSTDENVNTLYSHIAHQLRSNIPVEAAFNQVYNPTEIGYLCEMIWLAIKYKLRGIYHLAAKDTMSRFEFTKKVASRIGVSNEYVKPLDILSLPLVEYPPLNGGLVSDYINIDLGGFVANENLPEMNSL